ncbi:hypothetical protein [Terasakiella pusilla]|uniref:hypothetical protein n=1 Tax=Terasakiella pusilla TaxID=64973 RepID=UPI003AA8F9EC
MTDGFVNHQGGSLSVDVAFVMPVVLIVLMMMFELARMALVLIIGNLALDTALQDLRMDDTIDLTEAAVVAPALKEAVLIHGFGYLKDDDIEMEVKAYRDLATYGALMAGEEPDEDDEEQEGKASSYPLITVQMNITQAWATALPGLMGFSGDHTYRYFEVLGNLYQQAVTQ